MDSGFSLTEILVSLLLIISISLALLKQQWQVNQLLNQTRVAQANLCSEDNELENALANETLFTRKPAYIIHDNSL